MWFSFPPGVERITVEKQEFVADFTSGGVHYFRAPEHFAPRILAIRGFSFVETPPEGSPADLPKTDPSRDSAIETLTKTVEALKIENQGLTSDFTAACAQITALTNEKTALALELQEVREKLNALEEDVEDGSVVPLRKAK